MLIQRTTLASNWGAFQGRPLKSGRAQALPAPGGGAARRRRLKTFAPPRGGARAAEREAPPPPPPGPWVGSREAPWGAAAPDLGVQVPPPLPEEAWVRSQRCPRDANACFSHAPSPRSRQLASRAGPRAAGTRWPGPRGRPGHAGVSGPPQSTASTRGSGLPGGQTRAPRAWQCLCHTAWPWTGWSGERAAANGERDPAGGGERNTKSGKQKAKQRVLWDTEGISMNCSLHPTPTPKPP